MNYRWLCSDIVNIKIGLEDEVIRVHKMLLCRTSGYFNTLLTGSFAESGSSNVDMSQELPAAIRLIAKWLYLPVLVRDLRQSEIPDMDMLIHAWILADKLVMFDAKNSILDVIRSVTRQYQQGPEDEYGLIRDGLRIIKSLKDKPCTDSALYRFFIDTFAWNWADCYINCPKTSMAKYRTAGQDIIEGLDQVAIDVGRAFCICIDDGTPALEQQDPLRYKFCLYHEHDNICSSHVCETEMDESEENDEEWNS